MAGERQTMKLNAFTEFASNLANLSTCKRAQVGALICDAQFTRVLAIGYNGPPRSLDNLGCTNEVGHCGCVHAEANALIKLDTGLHSDLILITTTCPCLHCAGLIINSGRIEKVYYCHSYRDNTGLHRLTQGKILTTCYKL